PCLSTHVACGNLAWTIAGKHTLYASFSQTQTAYREIEVTIDADTIYYGLKIFDPLTEVPPNTPHCIDTVPFLLDGIWDTLYYPYDTFRISSPQDNPNFDAFDTIYVDPFSLAYTPPAVKTNNLFISYGNSQGIIPKTDVFCGATLIRSQYRGVQRCDGFMAGHMSTLSASPSQALAAGAWYAVAGTPYARFFQVTPRLRYTSGHTTVAASVSAIRPISQNSAMATPLPGQQLFGQLGLSLHYPKISFTIGASRGKRMYLFDGFGEVWYSDIEPQRYGLRGSITLRPLSSRCAFYYFGNYGRFSTYSSFYSSGGIAYQW
ncbi:MAG: hypothetical protein JW795_12775, partial [Chitinivibrionales bacterium]|nr:hypothetical protein [Chitinivibrionales bacterium]